MSNPHLPDAYFSRLLESLEDGLLAFDLSGCVRFLNPSAQEMLGLSKRQALGHPAEKIFPGQENLLRLIDEVRQHGRHIASHENFEIPQEYGSPLKVGAAVSPLLTAAGVSEGTILILRDLSRIAELEEAMKRADRLAMLGTLAAGLAHEVKNPLGGIRGAAQLLGMELEENHTLKEYTDVVIREVERINDIIEELMDLARPRVDQLGETDLSQILRDIVLLQKEAHRSRNLAFVLHIDPSIPPIRGDEALLTRLLLNLIKNAAEAVDTGGRIDITTRIATDYHLMSTDNKPVPWVVVEVADDGPGISAENLERIFTPFFTTKPQGTGLGLATCQKIADGHNGVLKARNRTDKGTIFTVSLPFIRIPEHGTTPAKTTEEE